MVASMTVRRAITAFVTFAFATLLCAPAFAGFWAVAAKTTEKSCCCGEKEDAKQPAAHSESCSCAGCGCTVEEGSTPTPYQGVVDLTPAPMIAVVAPLQVVAGDFDATPLEGEGRVISARGPPPGESPPLYILYDSFLN